MEGTVKIFTITVGDDSDKEEEFQIVESDESEDNKTTGECDSSCLAEPLLIPII
jgi:hypothetical protein